MKIIFVSDKYPYSVRDAERFGFGYLAKQGFDVLHWNLSDVLKSGKNAVEIPEPWPQSREEVSLQTLKRLCRELDPSDTLICVSLTQHLHPFARLRALRHLSRSPAFFTALSLNHLPTPPVKDLRRYRSLGVKVLRAFSKPSRVWVFLCEQIANTRLSGFFLRVYGIRPLDCIWAGASAKEKVIPGLIGPHTKIEGIHNFDFDLAIEARRSKKALHDSPFFVVLGGLGPLHPDSQLKAQLLNPEEALREWNQALSDYIDELERLLNMKCLVALHPRTTKENEKQLYSGRRVFRNQTVALCRDSDLVVTYDGSTSVSFAVLFRKPIITLLDPHLASPNEFIAAKHTSDLLGTTKHQLGGRLNSSHVWWVKNHLYEDYEHRYIKAPGTPKGVTFWEHVSQAIHHRVN